MNIYKALCITIVSFCMLSSISHADSITAQPFREVKVTEDALNAICNIHHLHCTYNVKLWHNTYDSHYYIIDNKLQLVKLGKKGVGYYLIDRWDFSSYQHQSSKPYRSNDFRLDKTNIQPSIHPALYPTQDGNVAVAILANYFHSFAGGGVHEQIADFLQIKPHGRYQQALTGIPFYFTQSYKACNNEDEYAHSPHCDNESWSVLHIDFTDVGRPYYQWMLKYSEHTWHPHTPKSATKVTHIQHKVMPFIQPLNIQQKKDTFLDLERDIVQ